MAMTDGAANLLVFTKRERTFVCLSETLWPHRLDDAYGLMGYSEADRDHPLAKDIMDFFQHSCSKRYDAIIVTHQEPIAAAVHAGYAGRVMGFSSLPLPGIVHHCSPDELHKDPSLLMKIVNGHIDGLKR